MYNSKELSHITNMQRIDAILHDEKFCYGLERIVALEHDRIFCRHDLSHLLDVARIAWIMVLENNLDIKKDIVYGAALLHDLGRYRQYEEAIPHALASAGLAEQILPAAGYTNQETTWIVNAIREHGVEPQEQGQLARILYDADKLSRNCFDCAAQAECKWTKSKRNRTIVY